MKTHKQSPTITIAVTTYNDTPLLAQCLNSVRNTYPSARLITISDGWNDPIIQQVAQGFSSECYYDDRLFYLEKGTSMWKRYFDLYLKQPTDYFFRIDTDTLFHRPLKSLPASHCYFGFLQEMEVPNRKEKIPFVQGGCMGFPAQTIDAICSSGILDDEDINRRPYETWGIGFSRYMPDRGLISVDKMMGYIAFRLSIPAKQHCEIYSQWYVNKGNARSSHYAITHPHKIVNCRSEIAIEDRVGPNQDTFIPRTNLPIKLDLDMPSPQYSNFPRSLSPERSTKLTIDHSKHNLPAVDSVVFIWDDNTWDIARSLHASQDYVTDQLNHDNRGLSNGANRYIIREENTKKIMWYRIHSTWYIKNDTHLLIEDLTRIIKNSGAKLTLSIGPASGSRPQDKTGAVNITNTARFDLAGPLTDCPFNHHTYTNDWTPDPSLIEAVKSCLKTPTISHSKVYQLAKDITNNNPEKLINEFTLSGINAPQIEIMDIATLTTNGPQIADCKGSHDHFACIEPYNAIIAMLATEQGCAFGFVNSIADPVQNANLPTHIQEHWGNLLRYELSPYASYNSVLAAWSITALCKNRKAA